MRSLKIGNATSLSHIEISATIIATGTATPRRQSELRTFRCIRLRQM